MIKYNQSNQELKSTKHELYETTDKLDKAGNDINKKAKYIDELKESQEKFDYQNIKVTELKNELSEKNENIKTLEDNIIDLKNKNTEIDIVIKKYYKEINELKKK